MQGVGCLKILLRLEERRLKFGRLFLALGKLRAKLFDLPHLKTQIAVTAVTAVTGTGPAAKFLDLLKTQIQFTKRFKYKFLTCMKIFFVL